MKSITTPSVAAALNGLGGFSGIPAAQKKKAAFFPGKLVHHSMKTKGTVKTPACNCTPSEM